MEQITKYMFYLILIGLVLMYFKGANQLLSTGTQAISNVIGLLQGRRADGNGVIDYAQGE